MSVASARPAAVPGLKWQRPQSITCRTGVVDRGRFGKLSRGGRGEPTVLHARGERNPVAGEANAEKASPTVCSGGCTEMGTASVHYVGAEAVELGAGAVMWWGG